MRRLLSPLLALCTIIMSVSPSFAAPPNNCSCMPRSETDQIERNDVMIEGKVISLGQKSRLRLKYIIARIEVQKAIKGTKRKYISVMAVDRPGECAVPFKVNENIRLAARKRGASYRTNICKIFDASSR